MDRENFADRFRRAAQRARDFAQSFLEEELPSQLRFRVELNASYDGDPLHASERLFPQDSDPRRQRASSNLDEAGALAAFWRDGLVPEWIDLSVVGVTAAATLVGALSCGRFTADDGLLYHLDEGYAPFHVLGPSLPGGYVEGQRFSIHDSVQAWERDELALAARHAERVRALELCGEAFDDAAIAALPAFPNLKVLALSATCVHGPGLRGLAGFPLLETLHINPLEAAPLDVGDAPMLRALRNLLVMPAPAGPWGFGRWVERLPGLDWLQLTAPGELFLDGRLPAQMTSVSLRGSRLVGEPRLCVQVEDLALQFSGIGEAELDVLLEPVRAVEELSLRKSAVGDAFAARIAARFDLRRLDLRDTQVSVNCLRALRAAHPRLRTVPRPPST
jgi:hypothetical protein